MDYNNKNEQTLVAGMTATELVQMLDNSEAEFAHKALCYYDGKQEQEVEKLLSHGEKGRKNWRQRGFIARYRNITKMIVEKSGMLFKDTPPQLEVRTRGSDLINVPATETVSNLLDETEWQETMMNLDAVVRLLKTGLLLVQWDATANKVVFDILHRANCNVVINPMTKDLAVLVQRTGSAADVHYYRVWTPDVIIDVCETGQKVVVDGQIPNTYGMIPAAVFYDTSAPRSGFWVEAPRDLVNANEMYNLHMTDSEFALSWAKRPTLFTNCSLDGHSDEQLEVVEVVGSALPRAVSRTPSLTAGPDVAVTLGGSGGETPFAEYKAPVIDIKPMDDVVQGWIKQTAADWSVRVRAEGEAAANSGFQVVVEEVPNLELRQTRSRMFEAGFKRLYRVLNKVAPLALPDDAQMFAVFAKPHLPVDPQAQEDLWTTKIDAGRATEIDYFIEVFGLSKEEAIKKWLEIVEFQTTKSSVLTALQPQQEQRPQNEDSAAEQQPPAAE